jgi:hypothetical protein
VAIRRSSSAEVEGLIAELVSEETREPRREAALARLTVIGSRAAGHLLSALENARTDRERHLLLTALERVPDARNVDAILAAIGPTNQTTARSAAVRAAAVRAARPLLTLVAQQTALLERLTVLALDTAESLPIRRAALDALEDLEPRTIEPIKRRLRQDSDPAVREMAGSLSRRDSGEPAPAPADASISDDPLVALHQVGRVASGAPLPVLHGMIAAVRQREAEGGRRRPDWTAVRGAIHVALARRRSSVALYDLREAFDATALHPLPEDFTVAVRLIGDATCLEPLARAWMHAPALPRGPRSRAWAEEVLNAFRDLIASETTAARRRILARLQKGWRAPADAERVRALAGR